jgi:type IV fimbrial biogenesis protein FimT
MDSRNPSEGEVKREGFTLVELIVVVALIGILTTIGFISILHYQQVIRVNASARDVAGHLRVARAQAVRDGVSVQVSFNPNASSYNIGTRTYYLQTGVYWDYYKQNQLPNVPGHPYPIPAAVDIGDGTATSFNFQYDGTASVSGVVYMCPETDNVGTGARPDHNRAVDWEATTGRVRVWEFYASSNTWR